MSGSGEERWRGGRPYEQNRQKHSLNRTMSAHSTARGGQNYNSFNAWGDSQDPSGPSQEPHVPVRGFNAADSKRALRRSPGEPKPFFYKAGKEANSRPSGPWGSKPNTMANGKDFFLELRKQVTALRQGSNAAGG